MKTTQATLLAEIAARCRALGRSPDSLCMDAGLSPHTWKNWNERKVSPTLRKIDRVLAYLRTLEREHVAA